MEDYKYKDLYLEDSIDKQLKIECDDLVITNENIFSESMTLKESICSQNELRFGCCEASEFKIKIANVFQSLQGKLITVSETIGGHVDEPFIFGRYKVKTDKPTADKRHREIVAYDSMYDILNTNVADWYNNILPTKESTITLKNFRDNFFSFFGIEQETISLINDSMIIEKTIEPTELSGKVVISCICEANGAFGTITRNNKFRYVFLNPMTEAVYPANDLYPSDNLYPSVDIGVNIVNRNTYTSCEYEDFKTKTISKLQIRKEQNDIGCIVGSGTNTYIIQDNFLLYGKRDEELRPIAKIILSKISNIQYVPAKVKSKGNPCIELGDGIRLNTKYKLITTYVLSRTLKGIQSLKDEYVAKGTEEYSEKVNSVSRDIKQLKGITNILEREVDRNSIAITDLEKDVSSKITQTADSITAEIKRAENSEKELASSISATAEQISLKVSKGDVSSEISLESGLVKITGDRFILDSTNCSITEDGTLTANNVNISGGEVKILDKNGTGLLLSDGGLFAIYGNKVVGGHLLIGNGGGFIVNDISIINSATGSIDYVSENTKYIFNTSNFVTDASISGGSVTPTTQILTYVSSIINGMPITNTITVVTGINYIPPTINKITGTAITSATETSNPFDKHIATVNFGIVKSIF